MVYGNDDGNDDGNDGGDWRCMVMMVTMVVIGGVW